MGAINTFASSGDPKTIFKKSQCKISLAVKEGPDFKDTDMVMDKRDETLITYFSDGLLTLDCKKKETIRFVTQNLTTGWKMSPKASVFSNNLSRFKFLEIDSALQVSDGVKVLLELFWYTDKTHIKTTSLEFKDKNFAKVLTRKEMLEIPEGAEKIGLCLSLYGKGKVKISKLRVRRSQGKKSTLKTSPKNQKSNIKPLVKPVTSKPKIDDASGVLISKGPVKKSVSVQKVTPKRQNLNTGKILSKPLKRIKVHALLDQISEDPDPFIQDAVLYGISKHPELSNNPYRLMMSLLKERREHAVLEIAKKYADEFGEQIHQLYVNALYALFRMQDVITYYESLPTSLQTAPFYLRRYQIALAWTGQNRTLYESISERLAYPETHRQLLANFIRYSELLNEAELKTLTQVILNNDPGNVTYFSLMSFYDLLIQRGMIDIAQSLTGLMQSKIGTAKREGRINHALLSANIAFHHKNYAQQSFYINTALERSHLLALTPRNPLQPVTAGNVYCKKDDAYQARVATVGPLITVIMTTWNSSKTMEYAVDSILQQTHRNLELIIVDDASSDKTPALIKKLAKTDSRIVPILLTKNGGTYIAKNHGRAIAKGAFVTCQDSDDWAHPEKLSRLLNVLQNNEDLVGVECGHIRISEQDGIQRRVQGSLKPDASSLMYRRLLVDSTVGFYDSVRAGADGEFKLRLQRYFGTNAFKFHKELLSIVEWSEGTLSGRGSEFEISSMGVFSPSRLRYRQKFNRSHEYGLFQKGKNMLHRSQALSDVHIFGPSS